jgi:hypothetical protein
VTADSFGNDAQVWQLTGTGLVVSDDGVLRFALPVFEQHFGAQAIRSGIIPAEAAAAPEAFPRWRCAVAFALSASEPHEAEWYMLPMARINPAAVSWVLGEIANGAEAATQHGSGSRSPQPGTTWTRGSGDPLVEGRRLRKPFRR